MGVSDQYRSGAQKQRVKIMLVDPVSRRIEALLKDGAIIQIVVWETPATFRWPQQGEIWSIYNENGYWHLGSKGDDPQDSSIGTPLETLDAGDTRIASAGKVHLDGSVVISGGATVNGLLSGTVAWTPGAIAAGRSAESPNITITGATSANSVAFAGYNQTLAAGLVLSAKITAANAAKAVITNTTTGALTPTAGIARVTVIQH